MIKTLPATTLLLVFFTIAAIGQTQPPANTEVIWGYEQNCSARNVELVKAEAPRCERVETENGTFYIATYHGVSVAMTYVFPPRYIRATVQVTNHSGNELNFDPSLSEVKIFRTQSAYLKGKEQITSSKNISADEAKALYIEYVKHTRIGIPFAAPFEFPSATTARQSQSSTVTYTTANGRITGVSTAVPNSPAKSDQTRINVEGSTTSKVSSGRTTIGAGSNKVDPSQLALYDGGFKAGYVHDDHKAAGYVFFERVKQETSFEVFRLVVGDVVFVFPEETLKEKRKLAKNK